MLDEDIVQDILIKLNVSVCNEIVNDLLSSLQKGNNLTIKY
jgi:hypothetical protein